jgi:hypothetical protein
VGVVTASVAAPLACDRIAGVRDLTAESLDAASTIDAAPDAVDAGASEGAPEDGPWTSVTTDDPPARLALDEAYLYWVTTGGGPQGGAVVKMPRGGGPQVTIGRGEATPNGFAVDDVYVYVTSGQTFDDGVVKRVRKDGTEEATIASGLTSPVGVAADDAGVYWLDFGDGGDVAVTGRVVAAHKDGGAARELITGLSIPYGIAVDGDYVYYTTQGASRCDGTGFGYGTVERVARDGGEHAIVAQDQFCPGEVVTHDSRVFWVDLAAGIGTVNVAPKTGDGGTALAKNQPRLAAVATDGTHVFWANAAAPNGSVFACTIASCASTQAPLASDQLAPVAMAIDSEYVYWANLGVFPSAPGTLTRFPLARLP